MVRTLISQNDHSVTIIANTQDEQMVIGYIEGRAASDAFDYAAKALDYFQFAILQMSDVTSIEVQVNRPGECIELTELKRETN